MSTTIVGAGLAGLSLAIKIKENNPDEQVVIVEKRHPESNTQIAGQRFRSGIAGRRANSQEEILELLMSRNNGIATDAMIRFANIADTEMNYWLSRDKFVSFSDNKEWFGPQWGVANIAGLVEVSQC